MSHLATFTGVSDASLTASTSCSIPVGATYCTLHVLMRGSDGGATTVSSATLGSQSFTLDSSNMRRFDTYQAVEAGYILAADMPSGTVTATATRDTATDGMVIIVSFFDDVLQAVPTIALSGNPSGGDPFNTSITMPSSGVIVDAIATSNSGITLTTNQVGQSAVTTLTSVGSVNAQSSVKSAASGLNTMGWSTSSNTSRTSTLLLGLESASSATDTITPDSTIEVGGSANFTYTGFASGDPNAGDLGNQALIVSGSTITLEDSFNVPDGTVVSPLGSQTINLGNGTETAASTMTVTLPAGITETTMATVDTATPLSMYALLLTVGQTLTTGDKIRFDSSDGSTLTDAGIYDWALPKYFTYINSSNQAYNYRMVASGVESVVRKLTASKMHGAKLSSTKLTAR